MTKTFEEIEIWQLGRKLYRTFDGEYRGSKYKDDKNLDLLNFKQN